MIVVSSSHGGPGYHNLWINKPNLYNKEAGIVTVYDYITVTRIRAKGGLG